MDGAPAERAAMATTLLAVVVEERMLHWISVGDSPLLLFRAGRLIRLNADHSVAGEQGENNVLRSALGGGRIAIIDWRRHGYELEEGDLILAASDGLWTLSIAEIAAHPRGPDPGNRRGHRGTSCCSWSARRPSPTRTTSPVGVMKVSRQPSP